MIRRLHPIAGVIGFLTILLFWCSTVAAEASGDRALILAVKQAIPWGFIWLIPCLAATGASGFRLAGRAKSPLIQAKRKRMPVIALNGLLVLVPCAFALRHLARDSVFGAPFVLVQTLELCAGATNLVLMALSLRDGLRLKGRLRRRAA